MFICIDGYRFIALSAIDEIAFFACPDEEEYAVLYVRTMDEYEHVTITDMNELFRLKTFLHGHFVFEVKTTIR